ncbi:MAG: PAS domain S-box protein [Candidatus Obscuribacterales bacterium]|nr:PAS domain S-box protein [Candidatus Obscuribacterales bacterium]
MMQPGPQKLFLFVAGFALTLTLAFLFIEIASVVNLQSQLSAYRLSDETSTNLSARFTVLLRFLFLQILLMPIAAFAFWKAAKPTADTSIEKCTEAVRNLLQENHFVLPKTADFKPFQAELDKLAESIAESRKKENAIFNKTADVICILDIDGRLIKVSPVCEELWGYSPDELTGHKLSKFFEEGCSDALETALGSQKSVNQVTFENKFRKKNGTLIDIAWSAYWSVKEQGLFCVAHDVTARKREEELIRASEEKLRQILQSLPVAVLMFDSSEKIEFANEKMLQLTGLSADEISSTELRKVLPSIAFGLENPENRFNVLQEARLRRNDAEDAMVEYTLTRTDDHRQERRSILAMLDVTERFKIEQAKRRFSALISHDLRTPITSLQLIMTMFKDGTLGNLNERGIHFAEKGLVAASGLIVLINDLLDLEKMRQGKMNLELRPERIKKLIDTASASVAGIATEQRITININAEDLLCMADGRRIVQVIINLLSNALKFSPPESSIEIRAESTESHVLVSVSDQGRGIPADKRETIFESYAQIKSEDAILGSGLGLPICKAIVKQHGGKIEAESQEGKGSRFWFTLLLLK